MKRRITDAEKAEFKAHIEEARPLKLVPPKSKPRKNPAAGAGGLDGNTKEKLKRGQLQPGARIDLHGMTEGAAHEALRSFLASAQARGVRLALVVTGVGNPAPHEGAEWMRTRHGVLKNMVPRWLNEKEFTPLAVGTAPAHRRHGGAGALYVYLRKKP